MRVTRGDDGLRARLQSALGKAFVLERELGGGAMSRVFVGMETALGRRVVLKVLAPETVAEGDAARFRREAVFAARLHHPHVVPVFTVGTVAEFLYYTMPFVDGEPLRARLERDRVLPIQVAARVLQEIASALAFAHASAIVHRDVKPENIVLEHGTQRALLADFGIACTTGGIDSLPHDGMTMGTPTYMSPEQVAGIELDGRSDIYSLGLVAWEMLTGVRPWAGESVEHVMYHQAHDTVPGFARYGIDVPKAFDDAIQRALRKDRQRRWQSAEDLSAAIAEVSLAEPPLSAVASSDAIELQSAAPATEPRATGTPGAPEGHRNNVKTTSYDRRNRHAPRPAQPVWRSAGRVREETQHPLTTDADDLAVATAVMSVPRPERAMPRDVPRDLPRALPRAVPVAYGRWIAAVGGAALVTAGIVGAGTMNHRLIRWATPSPGFGGGSDPTTAPAASPAISAATSPASAMAAATEVLIDTVPASVAAASLVAPEQNGSRASLASTPVGAVPATVIIPVKGLVARPVGPSRHQHASPIESDAMRGRAATATLALQAYQSATAAAVETSASSIRAPVDTPRAADPYAVLRAPHMATGTSSKESADPLPVKSESSAPTPGAAPPELSTPLYGAPTGQSDALAAVSPAMGVRVPPRRPSPPAVEPAVPVRVHHPSDTSAGLTRAP